MGDNKKPEEPAFPNVDVIDAKKVQPTKDDVHLATDFWEMAKRPNDIPCFTKSMGYGGLSATAGGLIAKYAFKSMLCFTYW